MIPYEVNNVLSLGYSSFYLYSLMYVLLFIIGGIIIFAEYKKHKLKMRNVYWLYFWIIVGILVGSRLFFVFGPWTPKTGSFLDLIFIVLNPFTNTGLVMYGGLTGGLLFGLVYALYKKLDIWKNLDIGALIASMGLFIGRLGCYFAGCCFGKTSELPWAIIRNEIAIHPSQTYSAIFNLFLFTYIVYRRRNQKYKGQVFLHMLLIYPVGRFLIEFTRFYNTHYYGLTASQLISIVFFIIGIGLLFYKKKHPEKVSPITNNVGKGYYYMIIGGLITIFSVYMNSAWPAIYSVIGFFGGMTLFLVGIDKGLDIRYKDLWKSRVTRNFFIMLIVVIILIAVGNLVQYGVGVKLDTEELKQCPHSVVGNTNATIRIISVDSPYCAKCWEQEKHVYPKLFEEYEDKIFMEKYDIRHCRNITNEYAIFGTPSYVFTNLETGDESIYYQALKFIEMKDVIEEIG